MKVRCGERIVSAYSRAHLESMKILEGILIQTSNIYQILLKQFKIQEDARIRQAFLTDSLGDSHAASAASPNNISLHDMSDLVESNNIESNDSANTESNDQ